MLNKRCLMIRLLLNRYHAGTEGALLKALPEEDSECVLNIPVTSGSLDPIISTPRDNLRHIHYSWIHKKLEALPEEKQNFLLSLIPELQAAKLKEVYYRGASTLNPASPMKQYLLSKDRSLLSFDEALPVAYLPETEMTRLARLTKEEIVDIIDFLGLYDLAEEIQHIVDKLLLEKVSESLTKKKRAFLKSCRHQKEKLVTQRLQLENWDGDPKKLMKLLHHRGMVRLGYALSGQDPDLIWHITHILDVGRGEKLARYCGKEPIPSVTETLIKQVMKVINFFEGKGRQ